MNLSFANNHVIKEKDISLAKFLLSIGVLKIKIGIKRSIQNLKDTVLLSCAGKNWSIINSRYIHLLIWIRDLFFQREILLDIFLCLY